MEPLQISSVSEATKDSKQPKKEKKAKEAAPPPEEAPAVEEAPADAAAAPPPPPPAQTIEGETDTRGNAHSCLGWLVVVEWKLFVEKELD